MGFPEDDFSEVSDFKQDFEAETKAEDARRGVQADEYDDLDDYESPEERRAPVLSIPPPHPIPTNTDPDADLLDPEDY